LCTNKIINMSEITKSELYLELEASHSLHEQLVKEYLESISGSIER
jgi:hypothetical protein